MFRRVFRTSEADYKEKLERMGQTAEGSEILDTTPIEPPLGYLKQPSMVEHIRALIQSEKLKQEAAEQGDESFDEADDFDVEDDVEPISEFEMERYFEPHPVASNPPKKDSVVDVPEPSPQPEPKDPAST